MAHGAGGKASRRLWKDFSLLSFLDKPRRNRWLMPPTLKINGARMAITTDSFVVKPLVFPGGSIGELAINGTVNDLAVSGARPEVIVVTFILESGLPTDVLQGGSSGDGRRSAMRRSSNRRRRYESRRARQSRSACTSQRLVSGAFAGDSTSIRSPSTPATRFCFPGRLAITESQFCWRAASSIWKAICALTRGPCFRWSKRAVLPAREFAGCAIRRAAAWLRR